MVISVVPTWAQGLHTASWGDFRRITVAHTWGAGAWPGPGGKQTISTEGHLTLLADVPLKNKTRQGKKRHCRRVFSFSSVGKPNLRFVIYNPPGVRNSDVMPTGEVIL